MAKIICKVYFSDYPDFVLTVKEDQKLKYLGECIVDIKKNKAYIILKDKSIETIYHEVIHFHSLMYHYKNKDYFKDNEEFVLEIENLAKLIMDQING